MEVELDPVDFVTVGTIGPKGKRAFYLQAGKGNQIASMMIEKEQAWALSEAIRELINDLDERDAEQPGTDLARLDMDLREPIEPMFRVGQMGLGYDEDREMIILVATELSTTRPDFDDDDEFNLLGEEPDEEPDDPGVVRMWCSLEQMLALSDHTIRVVKQGRADPKQNGRVIYYWT